MTKRLTPITITDTENGVRLTFEHGVTTLLTLDGRSCDCPTGLRGAICIHIEDGHEAYTRRKWQLVEENRDRWGPSKLKELGVDPRIFHPYAIEWRRYPGEPFVYAKVGAGHLFVFKDGAFFWLSPSHPEGGTKCSKCGTRTCKHVVEAREELECVTELECAAVTT